MLPRSSQASATSRAPRKAEGAQGSRFPQRLSQLQAINDDAKDTVDDENNKDKFISSDEETSGSDEETNELQEWSGGSHLAKHREADASNTRPNEGQHNFENDGQTQDLESIYVEPFDRGNTASFYPQTSEDLSIEPQITFDAFTDFPRNNPEPPESLQEPTPAAAARSQNFHVHATISDDRSKDSNIDARLLRALHNRSLDSPQFPSGSQHLASDPKYHLHDPNKIQGVLGGALGGGGDYYALQEQDYQLQLRLLEQQNKKRLMLARQEQEFNMMPRIKRGQEGPRARPIGPNMQPVQQGISSLGPRPVDSPNPGEQIKGGTPLMFNATVPSLLPEAQPRGSPDPSFCLNNRSSQIDQRMHQEYLKIMDPSMAGSSRPNSKKRSQDPDQIEDISTTSGPREYRGLELPANSDLSRSSASTATTGEQFLDWNVDSGPNAGLAHPSSTIYRKDGCGLGFDTEAEMSKSLDSSTTRSDAEYQPPPASAWESTQYLNNLLAHIESLQKKADAVKVAKIEREPPEYKILHRLGTSVYLDAPQWITGQKNSKVLKSSLPLRNVPEYIGQYPNAVFVVYRQYDKTHMSTEPKSDKDIQNGDTGIATEVQHDRESISIISEDLVSALTDFLKTIGGFTEVSDAISVHLDIHSPYLFIYHSRNLAHRYLGSMPDQQRRRLSCLWMYVYQNYRDEYQEVDALLQRRKIRVQYLQYLFRIGEVIVEREDKHIRGICSSSELSNSTITKSRNKGNEPLAESANPFSSLAGEAEQSEGKKKKKDDDCSTYIWTLSAWSWKFDGAFSHITALHNLTLEVRDGQEQSEFDIDSLNLFPLAFADEATKALLKKRGEMFWKCRFNHLVSYHDKDKCALDRSAEERFMIDLMTYRELHKAHVDEKKGKAPEVFKDDLGSQAMKHDEPPDEKFVYLVPLFVKGFNLQRKRWIELEVDRMDEVVWNKKAFKSLVLADKTKELLEALIRNQLDPEKSTDLIHGKGNGLILLLHGGPGTGKTLTAESVAEIAEKPLYRVTCRDIGTEPDEVEPYLESVLHLGKIWKGVVLLDEADVFLEQRSLDDLRRNALVSIFLRVLEYYDGILVLTSNRVGTFDEAFRSRIQLALHYPKLDQDSRAKVWGNFIERLVDLKEENIDFSNLRINIARLAENKMNGREIRNAITLARQYTQWTKKKLNFVELQDIIKITGQFDIYLSELNSHVTQDQLAQEEGLRLAEADR